MSNETVVYHPNLDVARAVDTGAVEEWAAMGWLTDRPDHITDDAVPRDVAGPGESPTAEDTASDGDLVTASDDPSITGQQQG